MACTVFKHQTKTNNTANTEPVSHPVEIDKTCNTVTNEKTEKATTQIQSNKCNSTEFCTVDTAQNPAAEPVKDEPRRASS